jgi:CrcB protein
VKAILYVAIGAALGGVARYLLAPLIQHRVGGDFPIGTLLINITGSFLLGLIIRYVLQMDTMSTELRLLLTTGFCGGYTTFSSFSYETAWLIQDGEYVHAAGYVVMSVGISLLATFAGFVAANQLIALRQR